MKPTVGRIVHFKSADASQMGNGAEVVPAIITRVWSDTCVNLTVMRDFDQPLVLASVQLVAEDELDQHTTFCFWPPRN